MGEVTEAIDLAQDFATLNRQRQPEALDPSLKMRDGQLRYRPCTAFARRLVRGYEGGQSGRDVALIDCA